MLQQRRSGRRVPLAQSSWLHRHAGLSPDRFASTLRSCPACWDREPRPPARLSIQSPQPRPTAPSTHRHGTLPALQEAVRRRSSDPRSTDSSAFRAISSRRERNLSRAELVIPVGASVWSPTGIIPGGTAPGDAVTSTGVSPPIRRAMGPVAAFATEAARVANTTSLATNDIRSSESACRLRLAATPSCKAHIDGDWAVLGRSSAQRPVSCSVWMLIQAPSCAYPRWGRRRSMESQASHLQEQEGAMRFYTRIHKHNCPGHHQLSATTGSCPCWETTRHSPRASWVPLPSSICLSRVPGTAPTSSTSRERPSGERHLPRSVTEPGRLVGVHHVQSAGTSSPECARA